MSEKKKHWLPPIAGRGRIVGRITWLLLAAGLVAILWMQNSDAFGDHGMANGMSMFVGLLIVMVWILWFLLASGQAWWMRLVPLVGAVLLGYAFNALYRVEGFSGEFIPRFVPRSAEAPDRQLQSAEALAAAGVAVDLVTTTPNDFPQFLGPQRDQTIDHLRLARDWQAQPPKPLWRQPIGAGWPGFSVVNGYAVTMEQRGDQELVSCYDADTGEPRWTYAIDARYEMTMAGTGPRATPTIDEGMVYTQGATGRLLALDGATGELVWEKDLLAELGMTPEQEAAELPYGRSGSPLVIDDLVVVPGGGSMSGRRASLIAYDKKTG
ncbi:MAG: PQQ-binding-like beta-propeller repeat protein, partial [Acidobacteriota bacterium]